MSSMMPLGTGKRSPIDVEAVRSQGLLARAGRAIATKLDQWFGPQTPMDVVAPPEVMVRNVDYPYAFNRQIRPRAAEPISFTELRNLSTACDLVRLAIETRKDQIGRLEWKFQPRRDPGETKKKHATRTAADPRIAAITTFFRRPDGRFRFEQWMRQIIEDVLVVDAVTIYPRRTLAGGPYTLDVIDPATIAIKIDEDGRLPDYPEVAYQQILKGVVAKDLTRKDLVYEIRNPRTGKFYGYGPVEQTIIIINTAIRRALMQLAFYTEGTMPESMISVPETWTPKQISDFQTYWDGMLEGNIAERAKSKFVPTNKVVFTKKDDLKNDYDEWIARVVMFAFSLPPTPFIKQLNRSTGETSAEQAQDEGMLPLMSYTAALVTDIADRVFGWDDLEFAWVMEDELDPKTQMEIDTGYSKGAIRPIDEIREERGWEPLGVPVGFPTATGFVLLPTPENQAALDQERADKQAALQARAKQAGAGGDGESGDGNPEDQAAKLAKRSKKNY